LTKERVKRESNAGRDKKKWLAVLGLTPLARGADGPEWKLGVGQVGQPVEREKGTWD